MTEATPARWSVWHADFGTPIGHEAGFERPVVVISAGRFNAHGLVAVCPVTRTDKAYPTRVPIAPGVSGLDSPSYIQVEQVRTMSTQRLVTLRGTATPAQGEQIEAILRLLFGLR